MALFVPLWERVAGSSWFVAGTFVELYVYITKGMSRVLLNTQDKVAPIKVSMGLTKGGIMKSVDGQNEAYWQGLIKIPPEG